MPKAKAPVAYDGLVLLAPAAFSTFFVEARTQSPVLTVSPRVCRKLPVLKFVEYTEVWATASAGDRASKRAAYLNERMSWGGLGLKLRKQTLT